jgi:integrase
VALIIKRHAQRIGLDQKKFSGHSLRAGFVTTAAQHGVASSMIRDQTGHKSDAMVQHYVRTAKQFSDNANRGIW